ncbi:MAG TPA: GTP cyclohydrolase II [Steroidobacter sp.]|uniref:GTP cyclohydrolase II n=1 Tax=Steroidobacter sp. TaxID=1978227 RepID=UPI002ED81866
MHDINGDPALVAIERAINELRCGRALYCSGAEPLDGAQSGLLVASAETASPALIARLKKAAGKTGLALAITKERADTLGLRLSGAPLAAERESVLLRFRRPVSLSMVNWLAGVDPGSAAVPARSRELIVEAGDALTTAVLRVAKHARLLPAVLVISSSPPASSDVLALSIAEIDRLVQPRRFELERVSEARVPLAGHEDCRLVLFRDGRDASEHVAVLIGSPKGPAVSVRLHSACLTGDLLGSLRCDCGDQLRRAVDQLAAVGGGVLLYLAQEGRGIGLANKLRAYELQDAGLDTIEADRHLGFSADERSYAVAASMLQQLGRTRIQLLTNNLEKIEALRQAGIEVVGGQRLIGAVNRHNARYVHAKRERAGHLMPQINMDEIL